jgi:hypothetical protein
MWLIEMVDCTFEPFTITKMETNEHGKKVIKLAGASDRVSNGTLWIYEEQLLVQVPTPEEDEE